MEPGRSFCLYTPFRNVGFLARVVVAGELFRGKKGLLSKLPAFYVGHRMRQSVLNVIDFPRI